MENVGQTKLCKSNPISGRILFVQKRRLILATSLLLALAVLGLFLSWTPNPQRIVIIAKPPNAKIIKLNENYSTGMSKGTSTREAHIQQEQQTQQNPTADKTKNTVEQVQPTEKELQDRELAARIDAYLAHQGSPMAGTGATFVAAGNATGVDPVLSVAIAGKESSFGLFCFATHNAWGMKAPQYCNGFPTWEEGILANSCYLLEHFGKVSSPYQCQGYCVPDHPWMEDVAAIMSQIQ